VIRAEAAPRINATCAKVAKEREPDQSSARSLAQAARRWFGLSHLQTARGTLPSRFATFASFASFAVESNSRQPPTPMTALPAQTVHSAAPTPIAALLNPLRVPRLLWQHRELIRQFTFREVQAANKDTMLGMLWVVLGPAIMLAIYTLVFGLILLRTDDPWGYALRLYCGLTLFQVFADPMNRGPGLVSSRPNFVKKVVFPLEILPISAVGVTLFYTLISMVLLVAAKGLVVLLGLGEIGGFTGWELLFPLALAPAALLGLGACALLSAVGVFVRDLRHVIAGPVGRALFFLTPLVYPLERVPPPWDAWITLNPLTSIVEFGRATLIDGRNPDTRWWIGLGAVTLMGLLGVVVGFAVFTKAKRGFADVL